MKLICCQRVFYILMEKDQKEANSGVEHCRNLLELMSYEQL